MFNGRAAAFRALPKLALLAHVRQDFSAPVGAILGYAEILIEDAPRFGLERFADDLGKMYQAGLDLQRLTHRTTRPAVVDNEPEWESGYDEFKSKLLPRPSDSPYRPQGLWRNAARGRPRRRPLRTLFAIFRRY